MSYINNKVAVITGAGAGIGQALAIKLAEQGCALALADISQDALDRTVAEVSYTGVKVSCHIVDVASKDAVQRFAEAANKTHGQIDFVINNAGVTVAQSISDINYQDFEWIVNINFWGVVYVTKAFLPHMKQREQGHIINVSSSLGLIGSASQPSYSATKYAVRGFTESLRLELADSPIIVSSVFPGGVRDTGLVKNSRLYKDIVDDSIQQTNASDAASRFNSAFGLNTVEQAATAIISGIEKKKARIFVGKDSRVFDLASRLFPVRYPKVINWFYQYVA